MKVDEDVLNIPDNYATLLKQVFAEMAELIDDPRAPCSNSEVATALNAVIQDILSHGVNDDWYDNLVYANEQLKKLRGPK